MTPVGVLGGSFDPVHRGHIALATRALAALGVARVVLVPCADPPHKPHRVLAARYHRLEMLYLALGDRPALDVSTIEIAREGVHYTIDTLRAFRGGTPPWAPVFLCGSDALADLPYWKDEDALLREFDFAAVVRPDDSGGERDVAWPSSVTTRLGPLLPPGDPGLGAGGHVYRIEMPPLAISSSLVRARCAAGRAVDDLVPHTVARYIQRHRLYSEEVGS